MGGLIVRGFREVKLINVEAKTLSNYYRDVGHGVQGPVMQAIKCVT